MLGFKMKKLDVYVKTIDGVTKQTIIGAIVTVLSFFTVILLVISEVSVYLKKDVVSHMVLDSSVGVESIRIEFDILFHHVPCEGLFPSFV